MKLSNLQKLTENERRGVIIKFQNKYKSKKNKEDILRKMSNSDINFLIYCMDNIYGKIFYSRFFK